MALTAKKVYAILKRQISDMEAKLNSPVRYRGTVATADLLPLNPDIGDMYNIESKSIYGEAGMNVAWNGVVWDTMGAPIDMSLYFTKEEAEAVIQRLVTEYFEKNPVKPGATAEQVQQIEQNKTDIGSLKEETGSLKEDLADLIIFPQAVNPFTEESYSYLGNNELNTVFNDDGFSISTSGINDNNIYFDLSNLIIGNKYKISFNVSDGEFKNVSIGTYSQDNVSGYFVYEFVAESNTISIKFTIWYTIKNFVVSNASIINRDDTLLKEEIRAKTAEENLQNLIKQKITKNDLADVISFADDGTNPFIETNYIYSGSHTPTMVFTEDGFDLKTGGYDDPAFYFDIPVKIGHNYNLSFTVSKGTFTIIINGTTVSPDENNRVSYNGVMEKSKLTVNFEVYYSDTEYIVKDALLTDMDSTTEIILSSWYKDKKGARFGDSITAQAEFWTSGNLEGSGWSTLVKDYFGCADIVNCGVGGSTVAGTSVTNAMWTDERITAIPSDSDFILFMGGTNDWNQNIPLGTLDSDDTNTFYGALNVIAEKLVTRFPSKKIIWMCNVYGKVTTQNEKNSAGLTLYDYSRAFIESANKNGFDVLDMFKSWTKYDCEQYLNSESDGTSFIHPNRKGGIKMADIIINGMKCCEPVIN